MAITVLEQSRSFDKKETYKMTLDQSISKISDMVDSEIEVDGYILFDDDHSGEAVQIISVRDKNGNVYATNSKTFRETFLDIFSVMDPDPFTIEVKSGISKNGCTYYYAVLL